MTWARTIAIALIAATAFGTLAKRLVQEFELQAGAVTAVTIAR